MKILICLLMVAGSVWAEAVPLAKLETKGLEATVASYQGKEATRLIGKGDNGLALLKGVSFKNGTIEVELAGRPAPGASGGARGFVGIAFRVQDGGAKYENIYLRPTNGRADDMLRRNHSTQYASEPDWPWRRLREETPGVYESYVDLESGAWTKVKIVVRGERAELYVHDAEQPCLIVKDLKLGEVEGGVALWIGPGTEAHFADLKVTEGP